MRVAVRSGGARWASHERAPMSMDRDIAQAMKSFREPPKEAKLTYPVVPATASQVHGNLWMGGWPPPSWKLGKHFDCLALCALEYQVPECFAGIQVVQARLNDDGTPMTKGEAFEAAKAAKQVIRWLEQDLRVLVTCFAGRNRSGLVCGLALCRGPAAMNPAQAIRAIRAARGEGALSNPWFLKLLTDLGQSGRQGT